MGISTEKIKIKKFLLKNLNHSTFSKMTFEEYQEFVLQLFKWLNELRNGGLVKIDLVNLVQKIHASEFDYFEDVLFERRFTFITEELVEFCGDPFFWNTEFDVYIEKLNKAFKIDWFKDPLFRG